MISSSSSSQSKRPNPEPRSRPGPGPRAGRPPGRAWPPASRRRAPRPARCAGGTGAGSNARGQQCPAGIAACSSRRGPAGRRRELGAEFRLRHCKERRDPPRFPDHVRWGCLRPVAAARGADPLGRGFVAELREGCRRAPRIFWWPCSKRGRGAARQWRIPALAAGGRGPLGTCRPWNAMAMTSSASFSGDSEPPGLYHSTIELMVPNSSRVMVRGSMSWRSEPSSRAAEIRRPPCGRSCAGGPARRVPSRCCRAAAAAA